jgi:hypothetical protein
MDTGEGGYPTFFILDSKWNPLDLTDRQVALLGSLMEERKLIPMEELIKRARNELDESVECQGLLDTLGKYPASSVW